MILHFDHGEERAFGRPERGAVASRVSGNGTFGLREPWEKALQGKLGWRDT